MISGTWLEEKEYVVAFAFAKWQGQGSYFIANRIHSGHLRTAGLLTLKCTPVSEPMHTLRTKGSPENP